MQGQLRLTYPKGLQLMKFLDKSYKNFSEIDVRIIQRTLITYHLEDYMKSHTVARKMLDHAEPL